MRKSEDPRAWNVCCLLDAQTAGRRILRRSAGEGAGTRRGIVAAYVTPSVATSGPSVHHRVLGKSVLHLMISLCPACHAKIHRTRVVIKVMPALLLELWRERHPKGHEQTALNFSRSSTPSLPVRLFRPEETGWNPTESQQKWTAG
jgi:hypothetical protein